MYTVMASCQGAGRSAAVPRKATPRHFTPPLYELMTVLSDAGGPDDALVVATAVHLLRSERRTELGQASTRRRMRP
jgi:hypothetical protein